MKKIMMIAIAVLCFIKLLEISQLKKCSTSANKKQKTGPKGMTEGNKTKNDGAI